MEYNASKFSYVFFKYTHISNVTEQKRLVASILVSIIISKRRSCNFYYLHVVTCFFFQLCKVWSFSFRSLTSSNASDGSGWFVILAMSVAWKRLNLSKLRRRNNVTFAKQNPVSIYCRRVVCMPQILWFIWAKPT